MGTSHDVYNGFLLQPSESETGSVQGLIPTEDKFVENKVASSSVSTYF